MGLSSEWYRSIQICLQGNGSCELGFLRAQEEKRAWALGHNDLSVSNLCMHSLLTSEMAKSIRFVCSKCNTIDTKTHNMPSISGLKQQDQWSRQVMANAVAMLKSE